jgi:hypothetical protein
MKRNYTVKVKGFPPFSIGGITEDENAEQVCFAIFGSKLEWVK